VLIEIKYCDMPGTEPEVILCTNGLTEGSLILVISVCCHKISQGGARLSSVVLCLGYGLDDLGFEFCQGQEIVLFS